MYKYWLIIKNTWNEYLEYRLNFILWRFRVVIRFLITYFLWSVIYTNGANYFGYTRSSMLTYVFLVYLVSNFVFASRTQDIGAEINEGRLTNHLLKPLNYFFGLSAREASDKIINFGFTVVEVGLFFWLLKPPLILQTDILLILFSLMAFLGAVVLYFFISLLISFIGFWTTETWAVRFIFIILVDYLAGGFFPIDILPKVLVNILFWTPLPYIFYFPVKIYLGQLGSSAIWQGLAVLVFWSGVLFYLAQAIWKKGLRIYSAEGR